MKKLFCLLLIFATLFSLALPALAEEAPDTDLLSCVGVSARIDGESNGLRTIYSMDLAKISALEAAGYRVEVGAILGVAEYRGAVFHSFDDLTVEAVRAETAGLSAVTVYATDPTAGATYTYLSYTEGEEATFAMTVDFGDDAETADADREKYLLRFVYRGFVILTDSEGAESVLYADPAESYKGGVTLNDLARTLTESGEYAGNAGLAAIIGKVGHRVVFRYKIPGTSRFEVLSTQYVAHGGAAVPPTDVTLPKGYLFAGWKENYEYITADCNVNAVLKETGSWSPPIQ